MILMSLDDLRPGMRLGVGMHSREGHMLLEIDLTKEEATIAGVGSLKEALV